MLLEYAHLVLERLQLYAVVEPMHHLHTVQQFRLQTNRSARCDHVIANGILKRWHIYVAMSAAVSFAQNMRIATLKDDCMSGFIVAQSVFGNACVGAVVFFGRQVDDQAAAAVVGVAQLHALVGEAVDDAIVLRPNDLRHWFGDAHATLEDKLIIDQTVVICRFVSE